MKEPTKTEARVSLALRWVSYAGKAPWGRAEMSERLLVEKQLWDTLRKEIGTINKEHPELKVVLDTILEE